jgi:hypothetical protein
MFHPAGILFLAAGLLTAQQPAASLQDLQARFPGRSAVYTRFEAFHRNGAAVMFKTTTHTYGEHKWTLILQDEQASQAVKMDAEEGWTMEKASISWTLPGGQPEQVGLDQLQVKEEGYKQVYSYPMPKLPKGTTLEVAFSLTRKAGLSGRGAFYLPTDAPVLAWHVEMDIPDRTTYRVKNPLFETGETKLEEQTDPVTLHRKVVVDSPDPGPRNWQPFSPWAPSVGGRVKWLLPTPGFFILTTEQQVSNFAAKLERRDSSSPGAMKLATDRVVQGKSTRKEKVEAIYAYLQKEIKPIEANKETGGIFGKSEFKFGEMLDKKEGAPEAIVALMARMLETQDIPCKVVIVHESLGEGFDPNWISSDEPFEVGVMVDMDFAKAAVAFPQNPQRPFGYLDMWELDRPAIQVMTKGPMPIFKTPAALPYENRYEDAWTLALDEQGNGKMHFERATSGPEGDFLRNWWARQTAQQKKSAGPLWGMLRGRAAGRLVGGAIDWAQPADKPFMVKADLDLPKACVLKDGVLDVEPWAAGFRVEWGFAPLKEEPRTRPIWIPYDQVVRRTLTIKAPAGRKLQGPLPGPAKAANALGTASAAFRLENGDLLVDQTLTLAHGMYPAEANAQLLVLAGAGSPLALPALHYATIAQGR